MANTPKHSVSVAGVVVDSHSRVLVIQRNDNGHWEPPGGVLELDETPEDGVRREIFEETGMQVEVLGLSGVYKNMVRGVVSLVFLCRPVSDSTALSDETADIRWVQVSEVEALMTEAYAIRVLDAGRAEVMVRSHDGTSLFNSMAG